ncbi:MAG: hypothetical protein AAB401_21330 [Acidobacteriota bacterium]
MQTIECAIEEIVAAHPNLYLEHCVVMAVALMSQQSASPCQFTIRCDAIDLPILAGQSEFLLQVSWSELTAFKARRMWQTEQPKPIIERAAVALAALLFARLIPDGRMQVTREGERADYWLPQLNRALEISGTTEPRLLARRHQEKITQMLGNPLGWNGYVVTCCIAKRQKLIRWSYHQQEVVKR